MSPVQEPIVLPHTGAQPDTDTHARQALQAFVQCHPRLFVLSGAGISTASGIPDYRDAEGQRRGRAPIMLQDFLSGEPVRRRYWARSMLGWRTVAGAAPNRAHQALAQLEARGHIERLVTQNVDGLHQRAGSRVPVELHGNLDAVVCMECAARYPRAVIQEQLEHDHPHLLDADAPAAPDGDAEVEAAYYAHFRVPACTCCGGVLKPDVVFFGEGVPSARVEAAAQALERADAMLVIGSSLMVYSGYRFCVWAARAGKPIAAINIGRTRADPMLALKVSAPCDQVLSELAGLAAPPA
jgi:NAD-dependent SIR2 family protein deacetylase